MTPLQYGLLTFAFALAFGGTVWALLRATSEPETLPSLPEMAARLAGPPQRWITKEAAECCRSKALDDGRPVIGFCGPDCERRPV